MPAMQDLIDLPVFAHSASTGAYVGVLRSQADSPMGAAVTLAPARTIRWKSTDFTHLDVAADGPAEEGNRPSARCAPARSCWPT